MFTINENPLLFRNILLEYEHEHPNDKSVSMATSSLTDEQLASIKHLEIRSLAINSLVGIEKLVNLESFSCAGTSNRQLNISNGQRKEDVKHYSTNKNIDLKKEALSLYNENQLTDITPLYKCNNLRELNLSNQRNINEIDISNFPKIEKLNMTNCSKLEKVVGLDALDYWFQTENKDNQVLDLNFTECNKLKSFDELVNFANGYDKERDKNAKITLPVISYLYLAKSNGYSEHFLVRSSQRGNDLINFVETNDHQYTVEYNARQMSMIKYRLDTIINTICTKGDSDITKIAKCYHWICDNIHYDHMTCNTLEQTNIKDDIRLDNNNRVCGSYDVLFKQEGVCVGASNLFNLFVNELGYMAEKVECSSEHEKEEFCVSDHQISKIYLKNENCYYCDPTWDLDENKNEIFNLKYFMLNKEEMSKDHFFTVSELNDKNAQSIQTKLSVLKILNHVKNQDNQIKYPKKIKNRFNEEAYILST